MKNIKDIFFKLLESYPAETSTKEELWEEIVENYSDKKRHYHNLSHLENLIQQLTDHQGIISDWDVILFAVFYHDIVYNVLKQDNEEKSAEFAVDRLKRLNIEQERIDKCKAAILATKGHHTSKDADINIFTDADLSILGADWETYQNYAKQVRQEYSIYPDLIYNPGRKKVLRHFLDMPTIFKTPEFSRDLEKQAKENLERELREL